MALEFKKEYRIQQPDGTWKHTAEICNPAVSDVEVAVSSWPYDRDGKKIGDRPKWDPPGVDPDKPGSHPPKAGTRGRVIKAGKCETFGFEFDRDPRLTYTDTYVLKSGTWADDEYTLKQPLAASNLPPLNPPGQFVCVRVPLPYPAVIEHVFDRPLTLRLKRLALPAGWRSVFMEPKIGQTFRLRPGQKEFSAVMLLAIPPAPVPLAKRARGLAVATVALTWGIEPVAEIPQFFPFERTDRAVFACDSAAPRLRINISRRGPVARLAVNAEDPAGIPEPPRLTITDASGRRDAVARIVPLRRLLEINDEPAIGVTRARYEVDLPVRDVAGARLAITLADQFGNFATAKKRLR